MEQSQINLVHQSFAALAPDADLLADLFYPRLFQLDPSARDRFPNDLTAHKGRLLYALTRAVRDLEPAPTLPQNGDAAPTETIGAALLWTLELGLGERYTAEVRAAWTALYPQLIARLGMLQSAV